MKKLAVVAVIAFVIWNAHRMPNGAEYFHPVDGESQRYTVRLIRDASHSLEGGAVLRNEGTYVIKGNDYSKLVTIFDGVPGMSDDTSYVRLTEDGIYSRNSTNVQAAEFLALPFPPTVGRKWRYVLDGHEVASEIAAVETLTTPGKTFHNCIKVVSRGVINGWDIQMATHYAPKAGVVKMTATFPFGTVDMTIQGK